MTAIAASGGWASRARSRLGLRLREEDGFTFPELTVVMVMLGIGMTAAFFFYQAAVARTSDTQARTDTLSEQRVLAENVAREAREAARLVIRDAGGLEATSGNILDIYGVETAAGSTRVMVRYDCGTTPGTCTRSTFAWDPGSVGTTVPVAPAVGTALTAPATEITGLDSSVAAFSGTASPSGSPLAGFNMQIQALPDGRDRPIRLEREITARNVCIYPAPATTPAAAVCEGA